MNYSMVHKIFSTNGSNKALHQTIVMLRNQIMLNQGMTVADGLDLFMERKAKESFGRTVPNI